MDGYYVNRSDRKITEMYRRKLMVGDMLTCTVLLFAIIGCVNCFPISENDDFYGNDADTISTLKRLKRSTNSTSSTSDDGRSAIERFFDDPNNKAMYLVFPIFVLIISTCCGLYFCDRAKKHFKKKKAERRKREEQINQQSHASSSNIKSETTAGVDVLDKTDIKETSETSSVKMKMINDDRDTPLEDVENCPEVKAVNALPIKHRETSFMTDVRNANKYDVDKTSHENGSMSKDTNIANNTTISNDDSSEADKNKTEDNRPETEQKSNSDINANVIIKNHSNTRPSSKESSHSTNRNRERKKVQIKDDLEKQDANEVPKSNTEKPVLPPYTPNMSSNATKSHRKSHRRESVRSNSTVQTNNRSISPETISSYTIAYYDRKSLPDAKKYPKMDKKFTSLSPEAIGEILQYYKGRKHMPDIIPDDSENLAPIKKKIRKAKYKILNG